LIICPTLRHVCSGKRVFGWTNILSRLLRKSSGKKVLTHQAMLLLFLMKHDFRECRIRCSAPCVNEILGQLKDVVLPFLFQFGTSNRFSLIAGMTLPAIEEMHTAAGR